MTNSINTINKSIEDARAQLAAANANAHDVANQLGEFCKMVATTAIQPILNDHFAEYYRARRAAKWTYIIQTTGDWRLCDDLLGELLEDVKLTQIEFDLLDSAHAAMGDLVKLQTAYEIESQRAIRAWMTAEKELEAVQNNKQ